MRRGTSVPSKRVRSASRLRPGLGVSVFLVLAWGLPSAPAEARLNLPQVRQSTKLSAAAATALRDYFAKSPGAGLLSGEPQNLLVNSLPENLQGACADVVGFWGDNVASTAYWRVGVLEQAGRRVWLAFRCGSRLQDFVRAYDERLALLRLDVATLELLPLGPDAGNDSTLYQLEFAERLALKGVEGFAFRVKTGDNPCCDGPESRSQERLMVFADTPHGAVESLAVVTARDDSSHCDDPEVDTETTYRAELKFERDSNNFVTTTQATFRETLKETTWENGKSESRIVKRGAGTVRYRWNPATLRFEELK